MVTAPAHYVHSTCGADALYSRHAAKGNASDAPLSIVHFVWGPKPWMAQLDGRPPRAVSPAVQADVPFANEYRAYARDLLGPARAARYLSPGALDHVDPTPTSPSLRRESYGNCLRERRPLRPCDGPA